MCSQITRVRARGILDPTSGSIKIGGTHGDGKRTNVDHSCRRSGSRLECFYGMVLVPEKAIAWTPTAFRPEYGRTVDVRSQTNAEPELTALKERVERLDIVIVGAVNPRIGAVR